MIPLDDKLRPTSDLEGQSMSNVIAVVFTSKEISLKNMDHLNALLNWVVGDPSFNATSPKRGWMSGIGGCPNVGGICIACTMPGFPDKYMPFMDEPPGAQMSSAAIMMYGKTVRALRNFTIAGGNREPHWRHPEPVLTSGYKPATYSGSEGEES